MTEQVNFYIRGPHGAGKVYTEMFKDKVDKQWKFTYLIVEINSPSPAQLMLESYVPAWSVYKVGPLSVLQDVILEGVAYNSLNQKFWLPSGWNSLISRRTILMQEKTCPQFVSFVCKLWKWLAFYYPQIMDCTHVEHWLGWIVGLCYWFRLHILN